MADNQAASQAADETTAIREAHRFDVKRLETWCRDAVEAIRRRARSSPVRRRPVQPHIPVDDDGRQRRQALCDAQEAAGTIAGERPPGRPRIPRDEGAGRNRRSRAAYVCALRGRQRDRHHASTSWTMVEGRVLWESARCQTRHRPSAARSTKPRSRPSRTFTMVDCEEGRPAAISARKATISRARSTAGPSSTRPPRPMHIPEMEKLIDWLPKNIPPGDIDDPSCTATTASTTWCCTRPSRA